jgi:hypothetical protein
MLARVKGQVEAPAGSMSSHLSRSLQVKERPLMPELAPDDSPASTDESDTGQPETGLPLSQPEHVEATEQPDEDDEPQAGSPS